ncbi:MAG TPA: hypothetical protein VMY69_01950, partial [Phycisphaerae bacterium]|nr:hypothetical protein [Phycisphaerae bacterium]
MGSRTNVKWLVVMGLLAAVVLGTPRGADAVTLWWDANGADYEVGQSYWIGREWNATGAYWNES